MLSIKLFEEAVEQYGVYEIHDSVIRFAFVTGIADARFALLVVANQEMDGHDNDRQRLLEVGQSSQLI